MSEEPVVGGWIAAAEGFFGMLKRERVNRRRYRSVAEARADVFLSVMWWSFRKSWYS